MPLIQPTPSPRYLPVNVPFSSLGVTVVTMDGYGNAMPALVKMLEDVRAFLNESNDGCSTPANLQMVDRIDAALSILRAEEGKS
jgi:hypothetical protein